MRMQTDMLHANGHVRLVRGKSYGGLRSPITSASLLKASVVDSGALASLPFLLLRSLCRTWCSSWWHQVHESSRPTCAMRMPFAVYVHVSVKFR